MSNSWDKYDNVPLSKALREAKRKHHDPVWRDKLDLAADVIDYASSMFEANNTLANVRHLTSAFIKGLTLLLSVPPKKPSGRGGKMPLPQRERKAA